jgi:hypothetical protein
MHILFFTSFFLSVAFFLPTHAAGHKPLNPLESFWAGVFAGGSEVLLLHPMQTIKNRLQQKQKISWKLRDIYRGLSVNAGSMVPITALQIVCNEVLTPKDKAISTQRKIAIAATAGAVSGLPGCASESAILYAQTHKSKPLESIKKAPLTTGLAGVMIRKSGYAAAYLAVAPALAECVCTPDVPELLAKIGAGLFTGATLACATQPLDTSITRLRDEVIKKGAIAGHTPLFEHEWGAAKHIYKEEGLRGLQKGVFPRAIRMSVAVPLVGFAKDLFTQKLRNVG